jgi:hypothetical protein
MDAGPRPLVAFADGFGAELRALGHRPGSVKHHLVLMGHLDRWLAARELGVEDLPGTAKEFLDDRRAAGHGGCRRWCRWRRCSTTYATKARFHLSHQQNRRRATSCWPVITTTLSTTGA